MVIIPLPVPRREVFRRLMGSGSPARSGAGTACRRLRIHSKFTLASSAPGGPSAPVEELDPLPGMRSWAAVGDPITDVQLMGGLANRRRSLIADGRPTIESYVLVGDASLYTNATSGQGVALGFWQAQLSPTWTAELVVTMQRCYAVSRPGLIAL